MSTASGNEERDINDLFDDITLAENHLVEASYKEGFAIGCQEGNDEGYRLGYAQGIQLGEELAEIFGRVVALQQQETHTERVKRCLEQLRTSIESFPRDNDPEADIIGAVENIRILNKKLLVLTGRAKGSTSTEAGKAEKKDLSF
ncbi:uncharacterized protein LOC101898734 [Musca domestica]|uniref:Uncharacterized protein LOC101898734 n=1 Tax=Musca domestica TaxID=7370 RepID=A0A1I8NDP8_MUSDO|nr:uncharacterized protein LOC101898734 [Musca domestica]